MEKQARKYPEIKLLKTIPGIGTIHACKIVSMLVTPERFENKYKFFSYCGLVSHRRESAGKYYGQKSAQGNRILKGVFRMAGRGISDKNAYNAVCRKIAALVLAVWRKKEKYDDHFSEGLKRRAKTNQP